ncbi:DNA polymerase IV [Nakamurella sp. YIM 132084]|uniref:DNA polymerase IV n=1 Tax=Nakamurella leprariae TaxID=2803911 RepID=A0A938YIJ3_9ACTN|nr:DNA polymerase IV [Nakamurella leprariae]
MAGRRTTWILHVDLDQFQVTVERLRRPELVGVPVVVGGAGDPTQPRTVVTCASYEARAHGVRSGMPLRTAHRRCPDAVWLPVDQTSCELASEAVMTALRSVVADGPVVVEAWGWDEAFVGVHTSDPAAVATAVRATVRERTGLTCSVGIGDTKLRAKTATSFGKPDGVAALTADTWLPVMGERRTDALWGIGTRTAARLAAHELLTVRDLADADPAVLAGWFGPTTGPRLGATGAGEVGTTVVPTPRDPRSRGHQVTFAADLTEPDEVRSQVARLAREVAAEVFGEGRRAARVGVTVRTSSFFTRSLISRLPAPTTDPDAVVELALRVLDRFESGRPVRLLGVRIEFPLEDSVPG